MSRSLKEKAIDIKGKSYVLVSDRVVYFNENYPRGSICTELVSDPSDQRVIVKATVLPDVINEPSRAFVDYSQAVIGEGYINKTSALENASTSAVGRALAYMGIGVIDSIASIDEIRKAETTPDEITETPAYKALYSKIVHAKDIKEINSIYNEASYKALHLEEKRKLQSRIAKAILNLKPYHEEDISTTNNND